MRTCLSVARSSRAALAAAIALLIGGLSARADANFDQGVRLFQQRNYKQAAQYFESAVRNSPSDSSACYYRALNYHYMGDWAHAKASYRQVAEKFPGSQAAGLSAAALQKIDPNYRTWASQHGGAAASVASSASSSGGSSGSGSSTDQGTPVSLPAESRVYFDLQRNALMVDAQVNGRPMKMCFDTGAGGCAFGINHLRELGISPPTGPATGGVRGVGSSATIKAWDMRVTMRVGNIERKNFPILVQEELPTEPLLGQTFYKDYEYTVDTGARSIVFRKKSGGGSGGRAAAGQSVPFKRHGSHLIVTAEVDGKPMQMYFDTGASGTVAFSKNQLSKIGLQVPEDAEEGISRGIGGDTKSLSFPVRRIKLGPIEKSNVTVSVSENSNMDFPLLGQGFYGDWQYTIDNDHNVINLLRR